MVNINSQNKLAQNVAYTGVVLAFPASGSLTITKSLPAVTMSPSTILVSSDVSGSLQINVPLSYFIINSATGSNGKLTTDFIDFSANSIKTIINANISSIASVGSLSNLFLTYDNYVASYFGNTNSFTLGFDLSNNPTSYDTNGYIDGFTTASNRILTTSQVITLLSDLSGSLKIDNLTSLLTYVCNENTFNNRTNDTFSSGFKAGDLIYFKDGIQINLKTVINNNSIIKKQTSEATAIFNQLDVSFNTLYDVTNTSGNLVNYTFTNSNTELNLNVNIPLLLRLV